jgi:hypothetical protein
LASTTSRVDSFIRKSSNPFVKSSPESIKIKIPLCHYNIMPRVLHLLLFYSIVPRPDSPVNRVLRKWRITGSWRNVNPMNLNSESFPIESANPIIPEWMMSQYRFGFGIFFSINKYPEILIYGISHNFKRFWL